MNEILSVEHLKAKYPRIGHGEFGDVYLIEDKVIKIIKSLKLEELEVYRKKIDLKVYTICFIVIYSILQKLFF